MQTDTKIAQSQLLSIISSEQIFKILPNNKKIRLSSGKLTNYYFDIRTVSSNYFTSKLISYAYNDIIRKYLEPPYNISIGGQATGALPIIMSLVLEYGINGFYVRKEPKKHGMRNMIEGTPSNHVLLVDDIVTTGKSILRCIDSIQKYNHLIKIVSVVPLLDRNKELENYDLFFQLKSKDIEYIPIFSSLDIISKVNPKND